MHKGTNTFPKLYLWCIKAKQGTVLELTGMRQNEVVIVLVTAHGTLPLRGLVEADTETFFPRAFFTRWIVLLESQDSSLAPSSSAELTTPASSTRTWGSRIRASFKSYKTQSKFKSQVIANNFKDNISKFLKHDINENKPEVVGKPFLNSNSTTKYLNK